MALPNWGLRWAGFSGLAGLLLGCVPGVVRPLSSGGTPGLLLGCVPGVARPLSSGGIAGLLLGCTR